MTKILEFYKKMGEISNKGLDKTKGVKRTKKHIGGSVVPVTTLTNPDGL